MRHDFNDRMLVCVTVNWKCTYERRNVGHRVLFLVKIIDFLFMKPASKYTYTAVAVLQLCRFLRTLVKTALMLRQLQAVSVELLAFLSSSLSTSLSSGRDVVRTYG